MPSTGRTTFVNTLCGKPVLEHKESDDPSDAHVEEGVKIQPVTVGASALVDNSTIAVKWSVADKLYQSSMRRALAFR